jgi:hypothetical protein
LDEIQNVPLSDDGVNSVACSIVTDHHACNEINRDNKLFIMAKQVSKTIEGEYKY